MTAVISPVVYGQRRTWLIKGALPHLIGGAIGGLLLGGLLTTWSFVLVGLDSRVAKALVAVVAILALAVLLKRVPSIFPTVRWQVPRRWLYQYGPGRASLGYGVVLGFGLLTIIYSPIVHVSVIAATLLLPPGWQLSAVAFGVTRAVAPLLVGSQVRGADFSDLGRTFKVMKAILPIARAIQVSVIGVTLLWCLIAIR